MCNRRRKIVRNGTTYTTIGELDDILLGAGGRPAGFQDIAVDADVAEFIDDEREPASVAVREHMADQGRLARAEKARDDRDRRFGGHGQGPLSASGRGGTRVIT